MKPKVEMLIQAFEINTSILCIPNTPMQVESKISQSYLKDNIIKVNLSVSTM